MSTYNILIIGDPVPELKPGKETTLALIFEGQRRGFNIDYCTAKDLCLSNSSVIGLVQSIKLNDDLNKHIELGEQTAKNLERYDMVILRSNPNGYKRMDTFYILDAIADKVFITNDPRGIRELHGKYFIQNFPDFIVPFAVVQNASHFEHFLNHHNDVVVKPINGFGGDGVRRITDKPKDIQATFQDIYESYDESPFIVQEYIKDAVKGDKRIIMFGGKPVCALLRVPQDSNSLANVTQGASLKKTELTLREKALCAELGPILDSYGLFFTGIDMLGDYLTEINVISVGTVVPANNLYGIKLEETFWDMLLERYEHFKSAA